MLCWQRQPVCLFIMERKKSAIEENLESLTKLTKNFEDVLEKLQDYDVLTTSELEHIVCRYFYVVYKYIYHFLLIQHIHLFSMSLQFPLQWNFYFCFVVSPRTAVVMKKRVLVFCTQSLAENHWVILIYCCTS